MNSIKCGFLYKVNAVVRKENLLVFNAILCFCYAVCYVLLIILPSLHETVNSSLYRTAVAMLDIIFLVIIVLTTNTIYAIYSQVGYPQKKCIRIVYLTTMLVWLIYILAACFLAIFLPGFLTHFNHDVQYSFRAPGWPMISISSVFAFGLSLLYREYYRQIKMTHVLFFIIPAIFQFSFKITFPFLLFIISWFVFGGCQLLLYFSIIDSRRYALMRKDFAVTGYII